MRRAQDFAADNGAALLTVSTVWDNQHALVLYESLGWVRDEEFYHYELIV